MDLRLGYPGIIFEGSLISFNRRFPSTVAIIAVRAAIGIHAWRCIAAEIESVQFDMDFNGRYEKKDNKKLSQIERSYKGKQKDAVWR